MIVDFLFKRNSVKINQNICQYLTKEASVGAFLTKLRAYNDTERIYQQYDRHLKQDGLEGAANFINSLGEAYIRDKKLIFPQTPSDMTVVHFLDSEYFDPARKHSVFLSKHNRYTPPFVHTHAFFEIFYVLSGRCQHTVSGKTQTLKEGDLCLLSPDLVHSIFVDDDSIVINILIRRGTIEDIFFNSIRGDHLISRFFSNSIYIKRYATYLLFHTAGTPFVRNQILEMMIEQDNADDYTDQIISSMLMMLFVKIAREHKESAETSVIRSDDTDSASRLLQLMLNNYSTLSLKALAKELGYSVPYCSKYIKNCTGFSFNELIRRIRFQKAENYLLNTTFPIAHISELIGYGNPENFTRVFRSHYGTSPAAFRQARRQAKNI